MNYETYLEHHGILGQKHGVKNGPPYPLKPSAHSASEKKSGWRQSLDDSTKRKDIAKKVAIGALAVGTVAAASVYVSKHPEIAVKVAKAMKNVNVKDLSAKTISNGKEYATKALTSAKNSVKEGIKEASKEAPKKLAKTVTTGAILYGGKKILDKSVGKHTSDVIFKANDPKQIGKFWKVQQQEDD